MEIRAKCVKTVAKLLHVLWFYKNCTQSQSADVFYILRSCFSLVRFGQVRENLGKNGAWSASNWKNWNEMQSFFWGHFLWSFFLASLAKLGKISSHSQKFAYSTPMCSGTVHFGLDALTSKNIVVFVVLPSSFPCRPGSLTQSPVIDNL